MTTTVLVLGGGPDAERSVSLTSARAVGDALGSCAQFEPVCRDIDKLDSRRLAGLPGEVIFPALHGAWGEGGPLQDLLEQDGRPFVGCGPRAARLAMDKAATKLAAASLGIATPQAAVLNPADPQPPIDLPVVLKPIHEGSSVGLHLCHTPVEWVWAHGQASFDIRTSRRAYLVERLIAGRELTVGVLGQPGSLEALPIVEIAPADGVYDFAAKYERLDTIYTVDPDLPEGLGEQLGADSVRLCEAMGVRHLARVDFLLTPGSEPMMLEVNTMPGFTPSSLLPKAAEGAGLDFGGLCARLVEMALGVV